MRWFHSAFVHLLSDTFQNHLSVCIWEFSYVIPTAVQVCAKIYSPIYKKFIWTKANTGLWCQLRLRSVALTCHSRNRVPVQFFLCKYYQYLIVSKFSHNYPVASQSACASTCLIKITTAIDINIVTDVHVTWMMCATAFDMLPAATASIYLYIHSCIVV